MGVATHPRGGEAPIRHACDPIRLSLFTRVFLANAAVLAVVTLLLLFSPIEISYPVTERQALILVAGFLVSLMVNVLAAAPPRGAAAAAHRRRCARSSRSSPAGGS